MGKVLRMMALIGAGLGATWAASQITGQTPPAWTPTSELRSALQADAPADAGPAPADETPAAVVPEVTQAEIEEALATVERTLQGGGAPPSEAVADKPLPADLAIALPSDI